VIHAVERATLQFDRRAQRVTVELHVGEVLEEDVVRLVRWALELLPRQRGPVLTRECVDLLADHHAEMLQARLVDALMDRWDELDERHDLAVQDG